MDIPIFLVFFNWTWKMVWICRHFSREIWNTRQIERNHLLMLWYLSTVDGQCRCIKLRLVFWLKDGISQLPVHLVWSYNYRLCPLKLSTSVVHNIFGKFPYKDRNTFLPVSFSCCLGCFVMAEVLEAILGQLMMVPKDVSQVLKMATW